MGRSAKLRGAFRVARRVLKWAVLAAAVGVAVVWVSGVTEEVGVARAGRWTHFYWSKWYSQATASDTQLLTIEGWSGGVEVSHQSTFSTPTLSYRGGVMWKPSFRRLPGFWSLCVPYWIPTLVLGGAAGILFWRDWRARRWMKVGSCHGCGYDRAGLATGAVCPECGKA